VRYGGGMKMALKKRKKRILKKKTIKKKASKKKDLKKKASKKVSKKKSIVKVPGAKKKKENVVGKITHYFPKVRAAVIKLEAPLKVGDAIKIKGHTTNFQQAITSMQIDRVPIDQAKKGQEIGLLVDSRVRQHDIVYKA